MESEKRQVRRSTGQGLLTAWPTERTAEQTYTRTLMDIHHVLYLPLVKIMVYVCIRQPLRNLAGKKPASLTVEPFYFLNELTCSTEKT